MLWALRLIVLLAVGTSPQCVACCGQVEGFSHLFRELKDHKNFLVCGEEGVPIEPKKRPLPSSNSSNDSLTGKGSLRNSKQARRKSASLPLISRPVPNTSWLAVDWTLFLARPH